MSSPSLKESVVTGALWVGLERWLNHILHLSIYVVLARLVGPNSFGLVALASVYISFIEVFVNQGFGTALIQRKELEGQHLDSAFWVNLIMATALVLGSLLLADHLAVLFEELRLAEILRWLSCVLILNSLSVIPQAVLVRSMAFRALSIRTLLATLIGGAVGLSMAWGGLGVWSLVGQQLSNAIVGTAVLWWATSWKPSFHFSIRHLKDIYGFAINILVNDLLWFGARRADHTIIGLGFGSSVLGPYALASRSVQIVLDFVAAPLQTVALPAFSRLQDERESLKNAFYRMTEVVAIVAVPAFCGLAALAPSFVPAILGVEWSSSIPLFQILAIHGLLCVPLTFGHPLMIAKNRPGIYLMLYIFQTCLTLGFCLLVIRWGPVAVACAMSLVMVVQSVVFLAVCRRLAGISIRELMSRLWAPTLAAIVMVGAVLVFQAAASERLGATMTTIAGSLLGASIYCAGMVVLKPKLLRQLGQEFVLRLTRIAA
jgi:O-antigen/teichoic acid export membrane protein